MCALDTDRQAELVRPLYMRLLDENETEFAKKRLIKALDNYGWRPGTGFLSTPLILDVLSEIDIGAAYRLLENKEIPGWLSMPMAGAMTIWEAWEGPSSRSGSIDSIMLCDGPHGLRKQTSTMDMLGIKESVPATCFSVPA